MLFVLMGTAAVIVMGGGDLVAIAMAHGFAIAIMVYMTANISGGHLNPAVTLAMMVIHLVAVFMTGASMNPRERWGQRWSRTRSIPTGSTWWVRRSVECWAR